MTKDEDFKLLKIQTCVLKVNIHCDGCRQKVKKLLQRIEGVYQVIIDAEQQKVTVSGSVDSATLVKKLVRAGKHAELWSQKGNQNQKVTCIKDDKNNKGQKQYVMKNLESLKNKQKFPFLLEEDDDCVDCDDEEYDEDKELQLLRNKINQMTLSKQKREANNTKKSIGAMTSGSNNPGKKGNPNQNIMMKGNPGGIDQKTFTALKVNNEQLTGANPKHFVEGKRENDISTMMNLAGFHGNRVNNMSSVLGGNHNGIVRGGGLTIHPYTVFPGNSGGYPANGLTAGLDPSSMMVNMNGYPSRIALHQQPQMMYDNSPFIPPITGYYYNYGPIPYTFTDPGYGAANHSSTHMFGDENTSSCSIM